MTTPEPMTVQDVTRLLHAAVEAYGPDWVDPNAGGACQNTYELDGVTRHCIAGWVLTNHGYDVTGLGNALTDTLESLGVNMGARELRFLARAQLHQDLGHSWGESVDYAMQEQDEVS